VGKVFKKARKLFAGSDLEEAAISERSGSSSRRADTEACRTVKTDQTLLIFFS
jgi:hypothetical protein